jgi:hypothetical protein
MVIRKIGLELLGPVTPDQDEAGQKLYAVLMAKLGLPTLYVLVEMTGGPRMEFNRLLDQARMEALFESRSTRQAGTVLLRRPREFEVEVSWQDNGSGATRLTKVLAAFGNKQDGFIVFQNLGVAVARQVNLSIESMEFRTDVPEFEALYRALTASGNQAL